MELTKETRELQARFESLKTELKAKIHTWPQNDKINEINENCFTLNSKYLNMKNWSPEYYNFKYQYEQIIEVINSSDLNDIEKKLQKIIKEKKIKITPSNTFHFDDKVINYLKKIF